MKMSTKEVIPAVTEHGQSVQQNQEHLVKSGSLPALNSSKEIDAGPTGLLRWHITADKFSSSSTLDGARSFAERWTSITDTHTQIEQGLEAMKAEMDLINTKMLKNNPSDVKEAVKRMAKRIQDMDLKMTILKNASNSFGAEIRSNGKPGKSGERKDKKRLARSPPEKTEQSKKKRGEPPVAPKRSNGRGFHHASTEAISDMEVETIERSVSECPTSQTQSKNNEEEFTLVRKKRKRPIRKKKPENAEQSAKERVRRRGKKRQQTDRINDAIRVRTTGDSTYAQVLKEMKSKVDPATIETQVARIRRARNNDLLIIVKKGSTTESFSQKIRDVLQNKAEVLALDYDPETDVDIRDIEEDITEEEVINCIKKAVGEEATIKCKMKPSFAGMQMATVRMKKKLADVLIEKRRIRIGWTNCVIKSRINVLKCYKCLGFGHISRGCQGPDRSESCYKCGKLDHKIADCTNEAICFTCKDKNYETTSHISGSRNCRCFKEELSKTKLAQAKNSHSYR